jgi:hypothetical protein
LFSFPRSGFRESRSGLRFTAIARVTEARWVCCAARDEIEVRSDAP